MEGMGPIGTNIFSFGELIDLNRSTIMDKATKTQFSIGFFIIGFILIFIQDLKRLDTINLGFSWPFAIMFYLGLICMAIGYYLK